MSQSPVWRLLTLWLVYTKETRRVRNGENVWEVRKDVGITTAET